MYPLSSRVTSPETATMPQSVFPLFLLSAALLLSGCGIVRADLRSIQDTEFAPELGINLGLMTRTESGLYFRDLEVGEGFVADSGMRVDVYYRGWLPDGTLFDATQPPATPIRFTLGAQPPQVIPGFEEGVTGMRVGSVRQLIIPPHLGYGNQRVGPLPPNSILVFEISLVQVLP